MEPWSPERSHPILRDRALQQVVCGSSQNLPHNILLLALGGPSCSIPLTIDSCLKKKPKSYQMMYWPKQYIFQPLKRISRKGVNYRNGHIENWNWKYRIATDVVVTMGNHFFGIGTHCKQFCYVETFGIHNCLGFNHVFKSNNLWLFPSLKPSCKILWDSFHSIYLWIFQKSIQSKWHSPSK